MNILQSFQSLCIISLLIFFSACDNSSATENKNENTPTTDTVAKMSSLDGAWELVWAKYNDTLADVSKAPLFKMFHDGIFSLIARDSSGKITFAGYGNYEVNGNVYKETFTYHNTAEYVGGMDWQKYELKGDTLYFRGFDKVVIGGKEEKDFPKIEEKRVRIK
jgi:hypothetical protein